MRSSTSVMAGLLSRIDWPKFPWNVLRTKTRYCTHKGWSKPQPRRKAASASGGASGDRIIMAGSPDILRMKKAKLRTRKRVTSARKLREAT